MLLLRKRDYLSEGFRPTTPQSEIDALYLCLFKNRLPRSKMNGAKSDLRTIGQRHTFSYPTPERCLMDLENLADFPEGIPLVGMRELRCDRKDTRRHKTR